MGRKGCTRSPDNWLRANVFTVIDPRSAGQVRILLKRSSKCCAYATALMERRFARARRRCEVEATKAQSVSLRNGLLLEFNFDRNIRASEMRLRE